MSFVLSNATVSQLQLVCKVHECGPECPLYCAVCGELVKDWAAQEAEVGFDIKIGKED